MKKALTIAVAVFCGVMLAFASAMPVLAAAGNTQANKHATADRISSAQAKEIALKEAGGGTVREIELEREKGKLAYEVEIRFDGIHYEVYVDAVSGDVLRVKSENYPKSKSPAATPKPSSQAAAKPSQDSPAAALISRDKAGEIAIARVGGGTVKEIELDRKNGKSVYEVELKYNGREYEVKLDAATGEIHQCRIDD